MQRTSFALGVSLSLVFLPVMAGAALAEDAAGTTAKAPTTGSTKPHLGNGPAVEKSLPSSAPAATRTHTTGATNQSKTVKTMNSNENAKVDAGGK